MTQPARKLSNFRVYARHVDAHHSRTVREYSFEAAAIAYVEGLHELPGDGNALSIAVRDIETGHEHSFRIELEDGGTAKPN